MASIKFRVRSSANKNVSIKVRLILGFKKSDLELNTAFSINPKDWSETTGFPKQNNTENKIIFNNLKKLESFLFKSLNSDMGESVVIDTLWLQSKINECFNRIEKTDEGLIVNYIQNIIDTADTRKVKVKGGYKHGISLSRKNSFIATKNVLLEYQTKTKKAIHFIDINQTLIDKFEHWLLITKKYAVNTASKHIANIKTVCLEAENKGIKVNSYAKQITIASESDDDRYIQTLSFDELEKIRTANITGEAHQNARKWLLIGCEIGQRGGDLLNITPDNIRYKGGNMYLDLIQQKTKKPVTIGIIAPYIIDILENSFPYKITTQKLNDHIKKVCEIAKINAMTEGKIFDAKTGRKEFKSYEKYKLITTHSFRRSFCSNYYKKIPTPVLMGISGHSKESIFRVYINAPEDTDENANLFMKFYNEIHKDKKPEMKVIKTGTKN
ncbi:phage integrase SAM-like domain-containing protein [Flavobacterium sp. ACN6]|uniref:phage integrase SAM-like domain-containing protein n=1 Tax=Flavobacterium sp. ACN6 TaxID=1920426 RepID=UPI000BB3B7E2|nr:phage integrase SAM-like domain-containing protein [Flavobacterium sp. ACN6]PBJ11523.1 Phage integrase family protein [Flavobacterium sp. ACN6]